MSYLGRSAKLSLKAQEKVSFLATAGQTVKTGLSYTPSFIEVYVNGVLLTDTTDFTATNGSSVTFTVALLLNDEVTVISLKTFTVADHYSKTEADTLLAAKATNTALATTNTAVALKAPIASPVFTGNVGIGVTPETWYSSYSVLQVGGVGAIAGETLQGVGSATRYSNNVYLNSGGSWAYQVTDEASLYQQVDGVHTFRVAPSGTADAAISWNTAMSIDNAGIVTKPLQPSFRAQGYASRPSGVVLFSSVPHNVGSHYNNSNGRFTAPIAGNYLMTWFANNKSATHYMHWALHINGNEAGGAFSDIATANYDTTGGAMVVSLAAGDYVNVYSTTGYPAPSTTASYSFFSGYLLG